MVTQEVEGARIEIDLDAGCRLASFAVGGRELLVARVPSAIDWGGYPMAPYAGRVRDDPFVVEPGRRLVAEGTIPWGPPTHPALPGRG